MILKRRGQVDSLFPATLLVLLLVALFYSYRFLIARAVPPFPALSLVHRGKAVFDTGRAKDPTLLAVSVSPKGRIGMLDSKSGVTQVFAPDGNFLYQTPAELPGVGKLQHPLGITFGEQEELYLADTGNQRIVQFTPEGLVKIFGGPGIFNGQFVLPTSLLMFDGSLFVLDTALCRVQQFSASGSFLAKTGRKADGPGAFLMPVALSRDSGSNIFVLDSRTAAVSQFDFLLNFTNQRRIAAPQKKFSPTRAAFAGEGLSFFLSKAVQEIVVFFQNTAVETLDPKKMGLDSAFWTDVYGQDNFLYILDGKNLRVDIFELM